MSEQVSRFKLSSMLPEDVILGTEFFSASGDTVLELLRKLAAASTNNQAAASTLKLILREDNGQYVFDLALQETIQGRPTNPRSIAIDELKGIKPATRNVLKRVRVPMKGSVSERMVLTLGDLVDYHTEHSLAGYKGIGPIVVQEIVSALNILGLKLKADPVVISDRDPDSPRNIQISDLHDDTSIPARVRGVLRRTGLSSLGQFVDTFTAKQISELKNCSKVTVAEIIKFLDGHGLKLKDAIN